MWTCFHTVFDLAEAVQVWAFIHAFINKKITVRTSGIIVTFFSLSHGFRIFYPFPSKATADKVLKTLGSPSLVFRRESETPLSLHDPGFLRNKTLQSHLQYRQ